MDYFATGVMSGTSLDGLDIAWCSFRKDDGHWTYRILDAETIPYSGTWRQLLAEAGSLKGKQLIELHMNYGHYIGRALEDFFKRNNIRNPGIVSCHGHTIFHRPDLGYTFQLGSGAAIASVIPSKIVCDFRSLDVALKGQGAPLVPIGDHLLFPDYSYCLNLGGFANISYVENGERLAYDICPLNFVINHIVEKQQISNNKFNELSDPCHKEYLRFDPAGSLARSGQINETLLTRLNAISYYIKSGAKSLGAEWVDDVIWPLINDFNLNFFDTLRTYYEHAAIQIGRSFSNDPKKSALLTGGGCYNDFLIQLIRDKSPNNLSIVIADEQTIEFKEALIFALLGLLYLRGENNCLSSVTGSTRNNIGGSLYDGTIA
jgi:anhydro-N-acetylmuramic acid kinase